MDLAFTEYGDAAKPPVVIVHGLYGSRKNWATIAKGLAETARVFTLDLRNHGDSPWDAAMDYRDMAADVRAFLAAQGLLGEAVVVGHSMGGKTAMTLALMEPAAVRRLVSVDMPPTTLSAQTVGYAKIMLDVDLAGCARRADVDRALAAQVPDQMVRLFLLQSLESVDGGFRWKLNLPAILDQWTQIADFPVADRTYDGPTLFLSGAKSDYVRPEHEAEIRRLFPQARLETVPDAGHWVHAEQPQAVIAALAAEAAA
ncbi:alpha/beta fold hydrolase [Caenispirillum bisanense]|uniref:Pimeloyl-ACP methyl ester carboxylesterase n=1 Tax=Caenispirillum bisanense TaxID=414052 RepID=A0A286GKX7_9PROT|nr:alpha/beta fold hydrolase [Caenispirillum bisanense]SOD96188.1 Pimeloyl-ACP methyl ester carboxylesterase [Caenispirillum bisanense]